MWDDTVAVSPSIGDLVGSQLSRLTPDVAMVIDILSLCEPLAVDVLCDLVRRRDLEDAEQKHLITVEHSGSTLMARLAHPLFGEIRRATSGELYPARIRGRLAQRLAWEVDADMHATVRRALLTLESELAPDPDLLLLDYQMPRCGGIEVLKKIKHQFYRPRVILWSSALELVDVPLALRLGADLVCQKPFNRSDLLEIQNHTSDLPSARWRSSAASSL